MEQLSRAAPFFLGGWVCRRLTCFSVTSERYVGAIRWLMLGDRRPIYKHTIPFWACLPCISSPLVTFFRRQSQTDESATAAEVGTLLRSL